MAQTPPSSSGGGSFFTHKVGPLPVWAWVAIGAGVLYVYRKYAAGSSSSSSANTSANTALAAQLAAAQAGQNAPTETITTAGGTYTGPAGNAPSSIYNPTPPAPAATSPTPGGGSGTGDQFVPIDAAQTHNLQLSNPNQSVYYQSAPGIFSSIPVTAFNPTSSYGSAYLQAPAGYTPPAGGTPAVSGVIQS